MSIVARVLGCAAVAALLTGGSAQADVLYSTTFETGSPGAMWSANARVETQAPFTRFLGRYSENEAVTLTLVPPETGGLNAGEYYQYELIFDFYAIDSWDGYATNYGPDNFRVYKNNIKLFEETFSNQHQYQSMRPADVGPMHMAYNPSYKDSIYRDIRLPFTGEGGETIVIKFKGQVMQGMWDESWGIDNVRVNYQVVPSPGAAALLGLGGLAAARRRR